MLSQNCVTFSLDFDAQNDDHGLIDGNISVLRVTRNKDQAVHFLKTDEEVLQVGQEVNQSVDWNRRFDHMQQHSGQHLISAVFEKKFNVGTASWWMAEAGGSGDKVGVSFVELATDSLTDDTVQSVEDACNQHIRDGCSVNVKVLSKNSM